MKTFLSIVLLVLLAAVPSWALEDTKPFTLHDAATADGNGTTIDVSRYSSVGLDVAITSTATVTIQARPSPDGTFRSLTCTNVSTNAAVTSVTASATLQCNTAGMAELRTPISGCSGCTVTVRSRVTTARIGGGTGGGGGGSGTVTSVDATQGVETDSGSPISVSGTIRGAELVNAQTGTTYTVLSGDRGKLVTHSNIAATAVTLPQAGVSFPNGWYYDTQNLGAGAVTITPTTSTIDGAASLVLNQNSGVRIVSNGTNYFTQRGLGGSTDAPVSATYITQTANAVLTNEQALSALATGCVNVTTGTGVLASSGAACGTVTSVDATGGAETVSGSAITATGTVRAANLVNAQVGTTYTVLTGDRAKLVTFTNAAAIAVTLPQAGVNFPSGWFFYAQNRGVGDVTITPTTSTIDGGANIVLSTNQGVYIASDGTNYFTMRGLGSGAPTTATYITQTASGQLSNEQALSSLATGCLNVTTGTGVIASTGVACAGGNLGITVVDAGNSPYTTLAGDQVLLCDTSAANRTINLITAAGNNGVRYKIKNIGGGQCTIDGAGAETIDGGSTAVLTVQYEAIEIVAQSTGARWHIF